MKKPTRRRVIALLLSFLMIFGNATLVFAYENDYREGYQNEYEQYFVFDGDVAHSQDAADVWEGEYVTEYWPIEDGQLAWMGSVGYQNDGFIGIEPFSAVTNVSTYVQLRAALTSGAAGRTIRLQSDIPLPNNWAPVNVNNATVGDFILDGNGFIITNLRPPLTDGRMGLFDTVSAGHVRIRNLGLMGVNLNSNNSTASQSAGGFIARTTGGTVVIENSFVRGTVSIRRENTGSQSNNAWFNAGGFIGHVNGGTVTIRNSYFNGIVRAEAWSTGLGNHVRTHAGGLVGRQEAGSLTIQNSYATGTITSTSRAGGISTCEAFVGGLLGRGSASGTGNYRTMAGSRSTNSGGGGSINTFGTQRTLAELRDTPPIALLNAGMVRPLNANGTTNTNINGGFPIFPMHHRIRGVVSLNNATISAPTNTGWTTVTGSFTPSPAGTLDTITWSINWQFAHMFAFENLSVAISSTATTPQNFTGRVRPVVGQATFGIFSNTVTATSSGGHWRSANIVIGAMYPTGISRSNPWSQTTTINRGVSQDFSVSVTPTNIQTAHTVSWHSSNWNVASVTQNSNNQNIATVHGTANGSTIITATLNWWDSNWQHHSREITWTVTVQTQFPTSISQTGGTTPLAVGGTSALTASVLPANRTPGSYEVFFESSDSSIVAVRNSGGTWFAEAIGNGNATVTAVVRWQDVNWQWQERRSGIRTFTVTTAATGILLDRTEFTLYEAQSTQLFATVVPATTTNRTVVWSSSNTNIARVDANGNVVGVNPGVARIEARTPNAASLIMAYATVRVVPEPEPIPPARISVANANAVVGGVATMHIMIADNPGTAVLGLLVEYDASRLEFLPTYQVGSILPVMTRNVNINANPMALNFENNVLANSYANGTLITLQFRVRPGAAGSVPVTVTVDQSFNSSLDVVRVLPVVSTANVNVSTVRFGDVDGNGFVNLGDVLRLRQYLAHHPVVVCRIAADVTGDGFVNLADVFRLRQYLGGHPVTLGPQNNVTPFGAMFAPFHMDNVRLSVHGGYSVAGEYVDVLISLDENPGLALLQLMLHYDTTRFEAVGVTAGFNAQFTFARPMFGGGRIPLLFEPVGLNNVYGTGPLATIRFRVIDSAEVGVSPFTLTYEVVMDVGMIATFATTVENGLVTIVGAEVIDEVQVPDLLPDVNDEPAIIAPPELVTVVTPSA